MTSIRLLLTVLVFLLIPGSLGAAPTPPDAAPAQDSLAGQLLVAAPDMGDPRFDHAVILIVHHDRGGAFGIIVNRPIEEQKLSDILADLGQDNTGVAGSIEIYAGGPVEPRQGFVLHSADYKRPETFPIDGRIAVTSSPSVLRDIAEHRGPQKFILAFGYAGWGPAQLEAELAQQAWFTAPYDPKLLFDADRATLWRDALARRSRAL